jgi:ubiquinone/menaquinone biosynthesis C-methylase UbiE
MTVSYRVNYDAVASGYSRRAAGGYLSGVTSALQTLARQLKARRVLDLGCGTGLSLQGLVANLQPAPLVYGLDFSGGMLTQARRLDPTYHLVQASAPWPPFAPASFDLVYCVHAFHHFPDKLQAVRAAYILLRPGGALAIVNFDPRESRHDWTIYEYFDGVYETDLERFPAKTEQERMLHQAAFQQVSSPIVQYISDNLVGEAVFDSYFLRKGSCSQLILLSEEAYQAGLSKMRAKIAAAQASEEEIIFRTELKNRMCHGFKPA